MSRGKKSGGKVSPLIFIVILFAAPARAPYAQGAAAQGGRFSKEGLSFDYPAGWALSDRSTAAAQHLILSRPGNSAVLMVVAYRDLLSKSEQIAAAGEPLVDNMPDLLAGGVLSGKASKKFAPEYTLDAKAAGAGGVVTVQIMVDEQGNVVSAEAVSGHRLPRGPSERAAKLSKFNPTTLCGKPIRVSGAITYNFVN